MRASRRINARGKRLLDLLVAFAAYLFLLPLIVTIHIAFWLFDHAGPVVVRTEMVGRRGKPFIFRTFRVSRPARGGEARRPSWLGALLKATELYRLPALTNVIAGDLSLVGPAPVDRDGLEAYGAERRYYLIARPGLITPWRSREAAPVGRCRDYVLNWRLRHDLGTVWWALVTGGRR
jgi:lipopolysaccharide/colanic/teichoic acid biosynthesis glycosyltransferase